MTCNSCDGLLDPASSGPSRFAEVAAVLLVDAWSNVLCVRRFSAEPDSCFISLVKKFVDNRCILRDGRTDGLETKMV